MKTKRIIGYGLLNALAAAAYVGLVALLISNANHVFGPGGGVLVVSAFLLVFVISAAVMGIVIFGRPILWYFNGKKREAINLVAATITFLVVIVAIVFIILAYS